MGLHIAWNGPQIYLQLIACTLLIYVAIRLFRRSL